ncbi:hypothetical protein POX_a00497 [Penicillium oxalicum]|uniref:Uncharacterized protein n=1 Tax=Penicillium oxalicum (strain 114-2 / CGMCC 5302) TaxID=933388 RepID=S7ZVR8_PENO1|nr:hypothetical protein POX_a00497 [Penicillium oxalicum]EPS34529.1 hypothetical protein PDE_09493 [Penicillium oxalicum 114-2]KAI2793909.1 hypothetical protein POX_a00497 [Penicillium oxalicum]
MDPPVGQTLFDRPLRGVQQFGFDTRSAEAAINNVASPVRRRSTSGEIPSDTTGVADALEYDFEPIEYTDGLDSSHCIFTENQTGGSHQRTSWSGPKLELRGRTLSIASLVNWSGYKRGKHRIACEAELQVTERRVDPCIIEIHTDFQLFAAGVTIASCI